MKLDIYLEIAPIKIGNHTRVADLQETITEKEMKVGVQESNKIVDGVANRKNNPTNHLEDGEMIKPTSKNSLLNHLVLELGECKKVKIKFKNLLVDGISKNNKIYQLDGVVRLLLEMMSSLLGEVMLEKLLGVTQLKMTEEVHLLVHKDLMMIITEAEEEVVEEEELLEEVEKHALNVTKKVIWPESVLMLTLVIDLEEEAKNATSAIKKDTWLENVQTKIIHQEEIEEEVEAEEEEEHLEEDKDALNVEKVVILLENARMKMLKEEVDLIKDKEEKMVVLLEEKMKILIGTTITIKSLIGKIMLMIMVVGVKKVVMIRSKVVLGVIIRVKEVGINLKQKKVVGIRVLHNISSRRALVGTNKRVLAGEIENWMYIIKLNI